MDITEVKRRPFVVDFIVRMIREKPLGAVGGIIVLIMLGVGILADLLAPYGMNEVHLVDYLSPPSAQHILGTDQLGRDLISRIIYGTRTSIIVSLAASSLSVLVATTIGLVSGYLGRKVDIVVQRFVDAIMCFPALVIALTAMSMLGPGLWQVVAVLGVLYGISGSRVVRSAVISIKENVYIGAAVAIGASQVRIIAQHILPNVMAPIIILFTIGMGNAILAEASLSFLGFGIPPPAPSWGGMLSTGGRGYMYQAPWMGLWPGLALALAIYGINMLGDAIRDILDPRLKGGLGRYSGVGKRLVKQRSKHSA